MIVVGQVKSVAADSSGMPNKVSANTLLAKTSRFQRLAIYWVISQPIGDLTAVNIYRAEFSAYLADLESQDKLIASGPILTEDGQFHEGDYAMLLRAEDVEDAHRIADEDPWVMRGLRKNRVVPFLIGDGELYRILADR